VTLQASAWPRMRVPRRRFDWVDVALWAFLVVIVVALAVAGWWTTRDGNGK
jgi:hypothetical protein